MGKYKNQTAVDWLIEQLTPSISLQQIYIDNLKAEAKDKEKGQIVDAIVCYFQVNDKTTYGMEYLSKLDNAISDALIYYAKTYKMKNQKSFVENIDSFKDKHGAIFENKTYEELQRETLEVKKLSPMERIGYLIEMYEKERERLMVILKPYYQKQQYAEAKEYQDRMNHITEFIAQLKIIK